MKKYASTIVDLEKKYMQSCIKREPIGIAIQNLMIDDNSRLSIIVKVAFNPLILNTLRSSRLQLLNNVGQKMKFDNYSFKNLTVTKMKFYIGAVGTLFSVQSEVKKIVN